MVLKADQERVQTLLKDTITLLCKNGLTFKAEFSIEALIGITLDKQDIFLVNINEIIKNEKASLVAEQGSGDTSDEQQSQSSVENHSSKRRRHRKRRASSIHVHDTMNNTPPSLTTVVKQEKLDHSEDVSESLRDLPRTSTVTTECVTAFKQHDSAEEEEEEEGSDEDIVIIKEEKDDSWLGFPSDMAMAQAGPGNYSLQHQQGDQMSTSQSRSNISIPPEWMDQSSAQAYSESGILGQNYGFPLSQADPGGQPKDEMDPSAWFDQPSVDEVEKNDASMENEHTIKKTKSDMQVLSRFLNEIGETRLTEMIPAEELDILLGKFFITVKKKDGLSYEPESLTAIQGSIQRYLRSKRCEYNIRTDAEFSGHRNILADRRQSLKREGSGVRRRRALHLIDSEIEQMYEAGVLGVYNPDAILITLWFHLTSQFGTRGRRVHHDLLWGDIELRMSVSQQQYLEYHEKDIKSGKGQNPKKIFEDTGNPRCPLKVYLFYKSKRPSDMLENESPFYLNPLVKWEPCDDVWFSYQRVGKNKLGGFASSFRKSTSQI